MLDGVQGAYFSELFQTRTRLYGASLGYQLSASVNGSVPLVATAPVAALGRTGVAVLFSVLGQVTVASTRETWTAADRIPRTSAPAEAPQEATDLVPRRTRA